MFQGMGGWWMWNLNAHVIDGHIMNQALAMKHYFFVVGS